jgi:integrase
MKFDDFVETIYRPTVLPLMASSTQNRYRGVIQNYLKPNFGALCLRDLTRLTIQQYLSGMVRSNLSYESHDKIRDVLSGILGSAVEYGLLVKNPVAGLRLPPAKRGRFSKPYITPAQLGLLVDRIAEPYAGMLYVAAFTGLRVSELVGLKWGDIGEDRITIDERFCRGDWAHPRVMLATPRSPSTGR